MAKEPFDTERTKAGDEVKHAWLGTGTLVVGPDKRGAWVMEIDGRYYTVAPGNLRNLPRPAPSPDELVVAVQVNRTHGEQVIVSCCDTYLYGFPADKGLWVSDHIVLPRIEIVFRNGSPVSYQREGDAKPVPLRHGVKVLCAFCGAVQADIEAVEEHIKRCYKHPMRHVEFHQRFAERQRDKAQAELSRMNAAVIQRCETALQQWHQLNMNDAADTLQTIWRICNGSQPDAKRVKEKRTDLCPSIPWACEHPNARTPRGDKPDAGAKAEVKGNNKLRRISLDEWRAIAVSQSNIVEQLEQQHDDQLKLWERASRAGVSIGEKEMMLAGGIAKPLRIVRVYQTKGGDKWESWSEDGTEWTSYMWKNYYTIEDVITALPAALDALEGGGDE